jgi:glycosyltransferase involved in cell wall biosynthesis
LASCDRPARSDARGSRVCSRDTTRATLVIQSFRPHVGGAELQLERLVPRLLERGVRTEIITRAMAGAPRIEPIPGSLVRRTPLAGESPLASLVYVAAALGHLVRRRSQIDLVHAHGALSPATIALGGRLLGLPCLVTVLGAGPNGDLARLARKPLGRVRSRLMFRSAWFAALSDELRQELVARGVAPERILVLPNGVDLDTYRPAGDSERERLRERLGLPAGAFIGTFVGRLHPVKDVDTLLAAAARVPALTLVVVGDGAERGRLQAEAGRLGLGARVKFLGQSSKVAEILRASDAFLLSTHGEGMSNALLEAMACGLPCLASGSAGGAAELLEAGRGLRLPAGDAEAWAAGIRRLLDEPGLGASLGGAAASFVAAELSLEAAADRLARAYAVVAS